MKLYNPIRKLLALFLAQILILGHSNLAFAQTIQACAALTQADCLNSNWFAPCDTTATSKCSYTTNGAVNQFMTIECAEGGTNTIMYGADLCQGTIQSQFIPDRTCTQSRFSGHWLYRSTTCPPGGKCQYAGTFMPNGPVGTCTIAGGCSYYCYDSSARFGCCAATAFPATNCFCPPPAVSPGTSPGVSPNTAPGVTNSPDVPSSCPGWCIAVSVLGSCCTLAIIVYYLTHGGKIDDLTNLRDFYQSLTGRS